MASLPLCFAEERFCPDGVDPFTVSALLTRAEQEAGSELLEEGRTRGSSTSRSNRSALSSGAEPISR
eukprot:scaffold14476_cov120-Isochrysis_galbana.AAC.8